MSTTTTTTSSSKPKASSAFTAEERAAMRARAKELKAATSRAEAEEAVLTAIAEMPPSDRALAERVHAIVKDAAPALSPKTWYGMPAYANDGKVVCYFKGADKFKTRVRDLWVRGGGHARRRPLVADVLCAHRADHRRRGQDPLPREEVCGLTPVGPADRR